MQYMCKYMCMYAAVEQLLCATVYAKHKHTYKTRQYSLVGQ